MKTKMTVSIEKSSNSETTAKLCQICQKPSDKSCKGCHSIYYCSPAHQKQDWKTHKGNCCPFILKENEEIGRYLVAARKLSPGVTLVEESHLICGPRVDDDDVDENHRGSQGQVPEIPAVCLTCCKKIITNNPNICGKCKWPVCGNECAKAKLHAENECSYFTKNKIKYNKSILPQKILYRGIMLLRAILKKDTNTWKSILYLQHERMDQLKIFNIPEDTLVKLRTLFKIDKSISNEELNLINNVIEINAFGIERVEEEGGEVSQATVLYHTSSLLAHSCTPNCTWSISYSPQFSIRIRTSKEIKKDGILYISYNQLWTNYGTLKRRKIIKETGGFLCKCSRCLDPTELGTFTSGLKCKVENCEGYLVNDVGSDTTTTSDWKCTTCGNITNETLVNPKVESIEKEFMELQTIYATVPMASEKLFQDYIDKYRDILHKNHWIIQMARRILVNMFGSSLRSLYLDQLENFISHCHNLLLIYDVICPGISLERGLYQLYLSRALTLQLENKYKHTPMSKEEKLKYLKNIYEYQTGAMTYWKDDIQTKPLDMEIGYEGRSLQVEMMKIIGIIATCTE